VEYGRGSRVDRARIRQFHSLARLFISRTAVWSLNLTLHLHHCQLSLCDTLYIMPLVGGLEERTFEHSTFMVYARDAKDVLQPNETQRNTLIVAGVYILVIGILWYVLPGNPIE